MPNLFSKDENLLTSSPIVGYEILKIIKSSNKEYISIFEVAEKLKKIYKSNSQLLYYGMIFLYSLDIIDFKEPYIICNDKN